MWKNYFKIAWRNIAKKKVRTLIHLVGLSSGIAICFLIYNLIAYSYSFDKFHPGEDDIYRIQSKNSWKDEVWDNSGTPVPLFRVIQEEIAGIEDVGYLFTNYRTQIYLPESDKDLGLSKDVIYANDGYFRLFPRKWLAGNPQNALEAPNQVVLSETVARKYFPDVEMDDILGKLIRYITQDTLLVSVSGVVADFDQNTDFKFSDIISISTTERESLSAFMNAENWNSVSSSSQLFVLINPKTQLADIQSGLDQIVTKYVENEENETTSFYPSPLSELHFYQPFYGETANKDMLKGLALIGLAILLMACFNFINLETAHAVNRSKEVGIRKALGSSKAQLTTQFLVETLVYVVVSFLLSFILTEALFISFKAYLPSEMVINYFSWSNMVFALILCLVLTLLSGFYPTVVLNNYRPEEALKGSIPKETGFSVGTFFRKNLTVLQFSLSIMFIVCVLVVNKQIRYVATQNLGFDKENLIYAIALPYGSNEKNLSLKGEVEQLTFVQGVSLTSDPISSRSLWTSTVKIMQDSTKTEYSVQMKIVDEHFMDIHKVELLAGRNIEQNQTECLINEALVNKLGYANHDEAIGSQLDYDEGMTIVGVMDNFHSRTLKEEILPLVMYKSENKYYNHITVRLASGTPINQAKDELNLIYKKIYPSEYYSFKFLEEELEAMYADDQRIRKILGFATLLAILISCLGLFGLASWTIGRRLKEISIRKVLGASVGSILKLVAKEYMYLVGVSFVVGGAAAYYLANSWLNDYVYKISMPWGLYATAGLVAFSLALLIVCLHAYGAAQKNPADILGNE